MSGLRNVRPVDAALDCRDGLSTNAVPSRDVFLLEASAHPSDLYDLGFGELARRMPHAPRTRTTPLALGVESVVFCRSERQVRRVHARRVVAGVHDLQGSGRTPMSETPRHSMSEGIRGVRDRHSPVAIRRADTSNPHPAFARPIGSRPELLSETRRGAGARDSIVNHRSALHGSSVSGAGTSTALDSAPSHPTT